MCVHTTSYYICLECLVGKYESTEYARDQEFLLVTSSKIDRDMYSIILYVFVTYKLMESKLNKIFLSLTSCQGLKYLKMDQSLFLAVMILISANVWNCHHFIKLIGLFSIIAQFRVFHLVPPIVHICIIK